MNNMGAHSSGIQLPELPDAISMLAQGLKGSPLGEFLFLWKYAIYTLIMAGVISLIGYFSARKRELLPGRLQCAAEAFVGGLDDFIRGIIGPRGREFTPFIATLFIYIFLMNLSGLIPFMKPLTADWSTTLALAICVFLYVQYTGIKELGFLGYLDHLAGRPRGILAITAFVPVLMFVLHILTELIRPVSLSLRLRSNIWGDDVLLAVLTTLGIKAVPLLVFNMAMSLFAVVVQAGVFCLLSTIYFALVLSGKEEHA